jgi:exodeoxyribonuclease VII small subunit
MTFENKIERVEEIIERVESNDTALEDALSLYKDGIALVKECGEVLQKFEEEVFVLQKSAEEFVLKPFAGEL